MFYSQTRSLVRSNVLRKRLCSTVRNEAVPESPALLPGRGYFVFVTGALAGGIGSLVGMGGAFVALPFLTGAFRLAPHLAHGTSMAAVLATSAGGCLAYMQRDHEFLEKLKSIDLNNMPAQIGNVNLLIGAAVAASSSVTVLLGTRIAHALSSIGLRKAMGVFMMLIAPTVPLREYLKNIKPSEGNDELESTTSVNLRDIPGTFEKVIKPLCVGACSGVLAGVFGVGGGAITVPALSIFTNLDYQVALGTSLFGKSLCLSFCEKLS